MKITAARLNDFTPVELGTTPTAATNFAISYFNAYTAGGITAWQLAVTYSGSTLTGGSGDALADTDVCTFPSDCLPQANTYGAYSTGGSWGLWRVDSSGLFRLLSLADSATITSSTTVSAAGAFATG